MNDELRSNRWSLRKRKSLEERWTHGPEFLERLQDLSDAMEQLIAQGMSTDEAEERFITEMRKLGVALMNQWAQEAHQKSEQELPKEKAQAVRHTKKNSGGKRLSE